jgi:NADPH:quinone reductase-like Zn-dependent oxidoreductase
VDINLQRPYKKYKINIMETIFAKDAPTAVGPFSHAMLSNGFFYCSGQIGINAKNMQLEGKSIEEQASKVFENVKSVLASKELMDLQIADTRFLITGATGGLGLGVSRALLKEGASIIAVGTDQEKLNHLKSISPENVNRVKGNLFDLRTADLIIDTIGDQKLGGVFLNASGPPAMPFIETSLQNWDDAYNHILKWKINLVQKLLPIFQRQGYGRILFSESISVKQPIKDLVLSNAMRLAVA